MDYKTKSRLSDQEIKWYYQGKMLDDADELGVYNEYLAWLSRNRSVKEIERMSDFFDSAFSKSKHILITSIEGLQP